MTANAVSRDVLQAFAERLRAAQMQRSPLRITGHGSKNFYGEAPAGEPGGNGGQVNLADAAVSAAMRAASSGFFCTHSTASL